jgi:uncharacterized protein (DUF2235 family)
MKRLVFCFDGTWNKLATDTPTNVVLTAASIERQDPRDGTQQIIHYDEGVGTNPWEGFWLTDWLDWFWGGASGYGLLANVREAYRFLIFNYDPGDQIFVFGFSRGAFSARTFVGFVRHVGVLRRLHVGKIDEAVERYKRRLSEVGGSDAMRRFRAEYSSTTCIGQDDEDWRCRYHAEYVPGSGYPLEIKYLGVWDTVGAMGWPSLLFFSSKHNQRYRFHDVSLTPFVENARHAVATDERRVLFPPDLLGDLTEMNKARGKEADDSDAPYQERWFPGVHGSVGGGGDIRGLSDRSLAWVTKGAKLAGLALDREKVSRIYAFRPDPFAALDNVTVPARFDPTRVKFADRDGPEFPWQVSKALARRWHATADSLPEASLYRPHALSRVTQILAEYPPDQISAGGMPTLTKHVVEPGDTLSALAVHYYGFGEGKRWRDIFAENRDVLDEEDDLFPGQRLRIPDISLAGADPIATA